MFLLDGYGKNKTNVICLVGDNCSVNQSIARTMEVSLIGCASHKLNLAVKKWIENQPELKEIIAKVSSCCRLSMLTCCAHFNQPSHLLIVLFVVLAGCSCHEKGCYSQGFC